MFPNGSHHSRVYSDKGFEWRPGRIYIPGGSFSGLIGTAGVDTGSSTGALVTKEISTFGLVAPLFEADGDVLDHVMQLPYDMDLNKDIRFRIHWTSGSATTADTMNWKVFYLPLVPNSTTIAAATSALTTAIAQDTVVGAYTYQTTEYGLLAGGTISALAEAVTLQVELDTFAVGLTEDKFLLGLEIVYSPKRLRGPDGMARNAELPLSLLDSRY
jgi:hypothetical protein